MKQEFCILAVTYITYVYN